MSADTQAMRQDLLPIRLRQSAAFFEQPPSQDMQPPPKGSFTGLLREAADEIERLHAASQPVTADQRVAQHFRYDKKRRTLIPAHPGYYWARWLTPAAETHEADQVQWPWTSWEIVQVNDNNVDDPADDEYLSVSVPGVRETQWRENFQWGQFVCSIERDAQLPDTALDRQPVVYAVERTLVRQIILAGGGTAKLLAEIDKLPILDAQPVIADNCGEKP